MAKVKGIITLNGTIGGITYYKTRYGQIAKVAGGGFNGEAIRTKMSMQRVRENGSEFGHCSKVNKLFRKAVGPFHEHYKFAGLHGHLMRLFTQLKDLDTISPRGQRTVGIGVLTEEGKTLLRQFNYTTESHMARFFPYQPIYLSDEALFQFDTIARIKFPKGATHLKLLLGVLDIDFANLAYFHYAAAPVFIDRHFGGGPLNILLNDLPQIEHVGLPVLGVRFYQDLGGLMVPLQDATLVSLNVLEIRS